ncbi:EAL domain-containing protein [Aliikangiella maris]|uniref:EAL domain-containing protein n=2 Tax=Aliikangiella maris TaxID=3162458 RepID=A0ABV2BTH2_9GAMM
MDRFNLLKFVFLFLLMTLSSSNFVSAEPLFQFHTLTKKDGLVSIVVFDMIEDNHGFIWLGTEDGLQKYDGNELITYRYDRLDENSLSNNGVSALLIDKNGDLWVGTENGLNVYDRHLDNFRKIEVSDKGINSSNIRSLYQTEDGLIWVGTAKGLNSIDLNTQTIKSYAHHKVRTIFEDDHKQLWVGTIRGGLYLFDRSNTKFIPVNMLEDAREGSSNNYKNISIVDIYQDSYGRIFVATWGEGVFLLERDIRRLIPFEINLPSKSVRTIHQDKLGQLWFGTRNGILVVEPTQMSERLILADYRNDMSLIEDNISSIYQGKDKTIWVGTYGGGVSRYFPDSKRFETYGIHPVANEGLEDSSIASLYENKDGNIWLGSESGKLSLFNTRSKTFEYFPLMSDGKSIDATIRTIFQDSDESVLLGTFQGLLKYDLKSKQLSKYDDAVNQVLNGDHPVVFITADLNENIWIGIEGKGVFVFRQTEGQFQQIGELSKNMISPRVIVFSDKNSGYIANKDESIHKITFRLNQSDQFNIQSEEIPGTDSFQTIDLAVDWSGKLWVGTWSKGLKIIDHESRIATIDESNGLPNNSIYSVIADFTTKNIWISSNHGLSAIDVSGNDITSFNVSDGLQGNEFNLPGIQSKNGFLYFGGTNGLNRFYPSVEKKAPYIRDAVFVDFYIANTKVKVSEKGILPSTLSTLAEVHLKYDQTPFSIKFTSPQFVRNNDLLFRYRLKGLSEQWITSDSSNKLATYTNIDPGFYEFELQVGNIQQKWNEKINKLNIVIEPPWWQTKVAYLIYTLIMLFIVGSSIFYYYQKRKREKQIQQSIQENEERLKLSLWGSGYEFWDWNLETGDISRSNEFKKIQIDCTKLSRNLYQLASYIHPADLENVRKQLQAHIAGKSKHFELCYRIVDVDKGWRWIQDRGKVVAVDKSGNALRMSGTQRDITSIKRKDEQFEMLGQAFKSTSDGVWIRDSDWRLIECNPAFEKISGFPLREKKGEVLWFPETQEQSRNIIQRIRTSAEEHGSWQGEVWAERKNDEPFPQKLSIDTLHDENGNVRYYVGVFSDITFRKRAEEEFRKLANYDSLTGLPNRACLNDRLNLIIEKTKRDNGRFALLLVDIDNFKRINDSLGHKVGDILLKQVGARLVSCNKDGDTVARVGGDEFIIVIEEVKSSALVATFVELLLNELNQPIFVKGQQLKLSYSIGITLAPDDAIIGDRLIRNADTAMNEAKKLVNNSYSFYSIEFNERARKRLELENALRKAIDDETIELYYQPKVDLNSGLVDGIEALARWTHKELGVISPAEFIPLAEETGLIVPLGHSILRQAAQQTKKWVDAGVMRGRTSVNLSANQFWNRNLADEITQILKEEGLENKYIELEITESACMQDTEETKAQIKILKDLGFSLALDDFGTGYSSLAQLKSLPFDTLKVDKSFVDNIETNAQDSRVVKAIIDIAKSMEMKVIIEGVESKSQCEYLWKNRAYYVQGFYFSRPVRSSLVPEVLKRKWHRQEYLGNIAGNVTPLG